RWIQRFLPEVVPYPLLPKHLNVRLRLAEVSGMSAVPVNNRSAARLAVATNWRCLRTRFCSKVVESVLAVRFATEALKLWQWGRRCHRDIAPSSAASNRFRSSAGSRPRAKRDKRMSRATDHGDGEVICKLVAVGHQLVWFSAESR